MGRKNVEKKEVNTDLKGLTLFPSSERGEFFDRFCGARIIEGTFAGHYDAASYNDKKNDDEDSPLYGKKQKRVYKVQTASGVVNLDESIKALAPIFRNPGLKIGNRVVFEYLGAQHPKTKEVHSEPLDEKAAKKVFPKAPAGKSRAYLVWGKLAAEISKK